MTLTKTDFKEYLLCSKSFWLQKKIPEQYTPGEFSLFLQKLIKDGYEVENFVRKLFPGGVALSGDKEQLIEKTKEFISSHQTIFQATFRTEEGLFAQIDILHFNTETKRWDIYEVKASSAIKNDILHNHIKDVTFQTIVVEKSLGKVGESYIIYINKEYRRQGAVDIEKLFIIENVSERIRKAKEEVTEKIGHALALLDDDKISLIGCDCLYKSHGQRCDSFFIFNPHVPTYSVHHIVQGKKLQELLSQRVLEIKDIPESFNLTDIQRGKVELQKIGEPLIDRQAIKKTISQLQFPLYFLDYETYGTPIPLLDGYKTNQPIVFQVSLHVLSEAGQLDHYEYLASEAEGATSGLIETLKKYISPTGSIIVWYESFEKGRNKELAELHPEHRGFLEDVNARIFDLMKLFQKEYLHPDFKGSASIKNVLPVLLPELSYKNLDIQNGTMALSEWEKIIKGSLNEEEVVKIKENLLKYCSLDTFAMVEIFRHLKKISH